MRSREEPSMKKIFLIGWKDLLLAFRDRAGAVALRSGSRAAPR